MCVCMCMCLYTYTCAFMNTHTDTHTNKTLVPQGNKHIHYTPNFLCNFFILFSFSHSRPQSTTDLLCAIVDSDAFSRILYK